ncbi:MAG: LuxR family transcriptional regulator [Polyangiaceae bacterium]|nr:LuxR family transcriptional regulator [Polyangiaceae bacterium]
MRAPMVTEVWARAAWIPVDIARGQGYPEAELFAGLPFDAASIRRMRRVQWTDYCLLLERVEAMAGGPEGCAALLARSYHRAVPELASVRRAILSPKAMYRLVYEVVNPILFPCVAFTYQDLGPRHICIETWMRPGVPPSATLLRTSHAALANMPLHLGLPPAEVVATVTKDYAHWEVTLPPSATLVGRVTRAVRSIVLGVDDDGTELRFRVDDTADESPLERATARWRLTKRQAQVLAVVVHGKSNKEVADELHCAENTVELHITQLLRRAGVKSRAELIAHYWTHR